MKGSIGDWFKSVVTGRVAVEEGASDEALLAELRTTRKNASRLAALFGVGIPALIVLYGYSMYGIARDINQDELVARIETKVTTAIWPALSGELDRLATQVGPKLVQSFGDALLSQGERMAKTIDEQLTQLQASMEKKPIEAQSALSRELSEQLVSVVHESFPEVTEDTARKALAQDTAHRLASWTGQRMTAALEEHVNVLTQIKQSIDRVKVPEGGNKNAEDVLWLLLEVVNLKFDSKI